MPLLGLLWVEELSAQEFADSLISIQEVVVEAPTALRKDALRQPQSVSVISNQSLGLSHESSLLSLLAGQVPGAFVTSRGVMGYGVSSGAAGAISIRGLGGAPTTAVGLLINGKPQYMGLMGHPLADSYMVAGIERVEVVRGPASVLYGSNAMGGVINIITRRASDQGFRVRLKGGYGSYNTIQGAADLSAAYNRFTVGATLIYNSTDGHRPNMEFSQYGARVNMGVELSRRWSLSLSSDIDRSNSSNPGRYDAPIVDNDARVVRGRVELSVDNRYSRASGSMSLYCNYGYHRINDGHSIDQEPLAYRFRSRDQLWGVTILQTVTPFEGNFTTFGIDAMGFGGETWNYFLEDGHSQPGVDICQYQMGVYANMRQRATRWLAVSAGVRYSYHSKVGSEWVPQGALIFSLPQNMELRGIISKGFRYPTLREMYLTPQQNPDLRPERVWNYELSAKYVAPKGLFSAQANIFLLRGDNRIESVVVDGRPRWQNSGSIRNWGVECELSAVVKQSLRLNLSYSLLKMERKLLSSPEHKLCAGVGYHRKLFSVSSSLQYVVGLYTELPTADSRGQEESFVLWDLRAETTLKHWMKMWLKVDNLLNQRYEINRGFPMPKCAVYGGFEFLISSGQK